MSDGDEMSAASRGSFGEQSTMKTLAAKLRRHASEVLDPGYPYYGTPELVRKAADEIDRLRAENQLLRAGGRVAPVSSNRRCGSLLGKK
jgi:hypothetical protein